MIPQELAALPQWCMAGPDKAPWSVQGARASSTDPSTWADYHSAVLAAEQTGALGLGFMLSASDCYTCIDLDIKENSSPEHIKRCWAIVEAFDSYTEYSVSGQGLHIWVKGKIGKGCRRDNVEVYSEERFIICTGRALPGYTKTIEERQELLDILASEIRSAQKATRTTLVEIGDEESDEEVWRLAATAGNGDKFRALCSATHAVGVGVKKQEGNYTELGYPSQSEADLSLLSMLAFYSKSNEQVRRMFRQTGLGKRSKATRDNRYLDKTLELIRGRQQREDAQVAALQATAEALVAKVELAAPPKLFEVKTKPTLDWPPGVMGELAQWFYAIAPRPVREVAIVSALGLAAGVYGRAFNISGSGLNLYIILVARSAIGKEAMHSGISKLCHTMMSSQVPGFSSMVDFNEYASGPALVKAVTATQSGSFVNVAGEWGRRLRKMSDDHVDGPMSTLRTVMTNLYQKSSAGTIVGGIGYSDKDKNIASTNGIAYSMIGETTPDTFYESLTNSMMQDGFMSRFIVVEHCGMRPEFNTSTNIPLPENLMVQIANGSLQALKVVGQPVGLSEQAEAMLTAFDKESDAEINATDDESWRQMWNRAHLKALKVAGLLAVMDNHMIPVVTATHAAWALNLIKRDIAVMRRKMSDGDVGDGDVARERKLLATLSDYLQNPAANGYKTSPGS